MGFAVLPHSIYNWSWWRGAFRRTITAAQPRTSAGTSASPGRLQRGGSAVWSSHLFGFLFTIPMMTSFMEGLRPPFISPVYSSWVTIDSRWAHRRREPRPDWSAVIRSQDQSTVSVKRTNLHFLSCPVLPFHSGVMRCGCSDRAADWRLIVSGSNRQTPPVAGCHGDWLPAWWWRETEGRREGCFSPCLKIRLLHSHLTCSLFALLLLQRHLFLLRAPNAADAFTDSTLRLKSHFSVGVWIFSRVDCSSDSFKEPFLWGVREACHYRTLGSLYLLTLTQKPPRGQPLTPPDLTEASSRVWEGGSKHRWTTTESGWFQSEPTSVCLWFFVFFRLKKCYKDKCKMYSFKERKIKAFKWKREFMIRHKQIKYSFLNPYVKKSSLHLNNIQT